MEDKQLNFNRPLLSVRRASSTVATSESEGRRKIDNSFPRTPPLPFYKSEMKSGPVRHPGTVPFLWEQAPGRPKDESKSQTRALQRPPTAPKLPPGRILNVKQQALAKVFEVTKVTRFQTGNVISNNENVSSSDKHITKYESSKEGKEETGCSGSEDGDEAYVDALDTLSRTESFFWNCSVSGLSGLDGAEPNPSGIFSTDPQTRDFMMGRFLPAAKAMASETPQYATWKQPIVQEQPRQVKKVASGDKQRPLYQYSPNYLPHQAQHKKWEESEDEDDYDRPENSSAKVCGLFPRFCLKNSFCLLNPVPGLRMHPQEPISSVRRTQAKSSYAGSCIEAENEHSRVTVYEQRPTEGLQTAQLPGDKNRLNSESSHINSKNDYQKVDRSTLYRHLPGNGVLPHHYEKFTPHEERGFLGIPEKSENFGVNCFDPHQKSGNIFQDLLAIESTAQESVSASPVAEKTLYIDSVHLVKSPNSTSSYLNGKLLSDYRMDDFEILDKSKEREDIPSVEFSLQDIKQLNVLDEKTRLQPESFESLDSSFPFSSERSNRDVQLDIIKVSKQDQKLVEESITLSSSKVADVGKIDFDNQWSMKSGNQESSHGLILDSIKLTNSKVDYDGKIDLESELHMKLSKENSHGSDSQLPLPPPLPKAPSESWLKRTLPTVSPRNSFSRSSLALHTYTRVQASKTPSLDPKWETIVKTSNVHHGHLRFSEELLTPIPEA